MLPAQSGDGTDGSIIAHAPSFATIVSIVGGHLDVAKYYTAGLLAVRLQRLSLRVATRPDFFLEAIYPG